MKKDDIRTLIVIVIICALITGLFFLLNRKDNIEKLDNITEYNTFFSIVNYINEYIDYIYEEDYERLNNVLSTEYKNNINNNISDYVNDYPENSSANIRSIKSVQIANNNYIYYAQGKIIQNNFEESVVVDNDFSIIILIDYNNLTYALYPIDSNNYKKIINSIKKINISPNTNNNLVKSRLITKEEICVLYMSDYVDKTNTDIDSAYNLLTTKMKEKYSSVDIYKDYIDSNKNKITTVADKCRVSESNDNTRTYYVIDENENEYTFYEDGVMNYTVEYYLK